MDMQAEASVFESVQPSVTVLTALGDEDNWSCPICFDLLYKPCANACGHVFCFWCMHHAMSPFRPSQCPLCRASYAHFPRVCIPLHHLLAAAFPAQYTARAAESAALEAVQAVQSVEVVPLSAREQQLLGAALHAPAHTVGTCRPQQQQQQACEAGPSRSNDTGHGSSSSSSRVAEAQAAPAAGAAGAAVQAGSGAVTDAAVAVAAGGDGMLAAAAAAQGDAVFEDAAPGVPALLRCAVAGCGRLLHEPLTLNCGCVVCSSCALTPPPPPVVATSTASATGTSLSPVECVPAAAGAAVQAAQRDAAASEEAGAEAGGSCHSTQSQHSLPGVSEAQASVAASSSSSVGVSSFHCPCCHSSTGPRPRPCYKLGEALQLLYTHTYTTRAHEIQAAQAARARAAADVSAAGSSIGDGSVQPSSQAHAATSSKACKLPGFAAFLTTTPPPSTHAIWQHLCAQLSAHADSVYTWYSVGCDDCGAFPIIGRRYRCMDCPEAVGYDLCGPCHERGLSGRGRFNQAHRPCHVLERVPPDLALTDLSDPGQLMGLMNCLEVLCPEVHVEVSLGMLLQGMAGPGALSGLLSAMQAPAAASREGAAGGGVEGVVVLGGAQRARQRAQVQVQAAADARLSLGADHITASGSSSSRGSGSGGGGGGGGGGGASLGWGGGGAAALWGPWPTALQETRVGSSRGQQGQDDAAGPGQAEHANIGHARAADGTHEAGHEGGPGPGAGTGAVNGRLGGACVLQ